MNTIDWGKLVGQGRAKAHGIPWSDEENAALALGIPADYVREGVLTLEDLAEAKEADEAVAKETGEDPVKRMNMNQLKKKAKELGITITPEATVASLREVIIAKLAAPAEENTDGADTTEGNTEGDQKEGEEAKQPNE